MVPRAGKVAGRASMSATSAAQASRTIAGPQLDGKKPPFAAPSPATAPKAMTPLRIRGFFQQRRRVGPMGKDGGVDVRMKRAYDDALPSDGYRVLIDRLWPRGVSKQKAQLDAWEKELAPSTGLREWFGHEPARFDEFRRRYLTE